MSLLLLKHKSSKEVIQKRDRVSLIVNFSMDTFLVFFKDKSFVHLTRHRETLKEGKLQFVPTDYLRSNVQSRIILLGTNEQSCHLCTVIDVEQNYRMQTRQISNNKPSLSTKHHLVESYEKGNKSFYLVRITKNVQNGISVEVFDFFQNLWSQQILHLGSKFLLYQLLDSHLSNENYSQASDLDCSTFVLVSQGDKFDSINYSKIKICHEKFENQIILKTKFVITREPKLKNQQFVIIGCKQVSKNKIMLVGNSKKVLNVNQFTHSAAFILLNTHMVQNDQPQQIIVHQASFPLKNNPSLLIRSLIGIIDGNIVVLLKITEKSWGIAKLNENSCQLLIELDKQKPPKIYISASCDSLYSYELLHQYFFEKIKLSPTVIEFNLFKVQRKILQYQRLLKYAFPQLSQHFSDLILHLL